MRSIKLHKVSHSLLLASLLGVGAAILAPAPAHASVAGNGSQIGSSLTPSPSQIALAAEVILS